jgi:hypothetical protein
MSQHPLSQALIRESIAGEEDPGASLDIVRSLLNGAAAGAPHPASPQVIHMDCAEGSDVIKVDVRWPDRSDNKGAAELLGLVVGYHDRIVSTAWSWCASTGKHAIGN